jgi:electron transfer flavoprotein beta subunit
MKIVVCCKAVPEFEQVVEADWDNFSLSADLGYARRVFGCFDESALETALRLRTAWEELGEKTECTALTAAFLPSPLRKTLFAVGFDRVVDLSGAFQGAASQGDEPQEAGTSEFRPRTVAAVLGNYLSSFPCDLILAGRQTGYADTGTVPLLLAEALGIPVITEVGEIFPCAGGVEVTRISDAGRERLRVRPPLVAIIGNSPVAALRAATLSARMAASRRSAEKPELPAAGPTSAETLRFSREGRHKTCRFLPAGADLSQSAAFLVRDYLGGWEG